MPFFISRNVVTDNIQIYQTPPHPYTHTYEVHLAEEKWSEIELVCSRNLATPIPSILFSPSLAEF